MKHFEASGLGRVILLEIERGEKIIESIEEKLNELNIKNAFIASSVGSIKHLEYHRPLTFELAATDEYLQVDSPFEIGNISGTIIDGKAHLHFSVGSFEGLHIGHIERGTEVLYLAEFTIIEIEGLNIERRLTPEKVNKLFPKL